MTSFHQVSPLCFPGCIFPGCNPRGGERLSQNLKVFPLDNEKLRQPKWSKPEGLLMILKGLGDDATLSKPDVWQEKSKVSSPAWCLWGLQYMVPGGSKRVPVVQATVVTPHAVLSSLIVAPSSMFHRLSFKELYFLNKMDGFRHSNCGNINYC